MSEKPKLHAVGSGGDGAAPVVSEDAADIEALWLDPELGDGITDVGVHSVPIGKPKDFFRTIADPAYRRRAEIYTHKPENEIGEAYYIIAPRMQAKVSEGRPCTLVTVIYRDGTLRIWPIFFPRAGEKDNSAWVSARRAAKIGMGTWVKLVWVGRSYLTREAQPGYAPDPDTSKLPPFNELIRLAFGDDGIIRDDGHSIYRDLLGAPKKPEIDADELGDV